MDKLETGNKNRILVVDDEPRILRFVKLSLGSHGFDVFTASSGEEALKIITSQKFDLMILDIFMPGIDGFAVIENLRAREARECSPQLPIIVFSARSSVAEQAFSFGANDFISKPFLPEELAEKICNVINHR